MRLGLGIGVNRKTPVSQYQFINAVASTYFSALEVAGFTEVQSLSLYSLDFNTIKEDIDDYFITLSDESITLPVAKYLIIGGTAATHAINAVNPGTFNMTWVNSPTHSATGVDFNGTSQYGKTGLIGSVDLTNNDTHIAAYSRENVSNGEIVLGARGTGGANQQMLINIRTAINDFQSQLYNNITGQGIVQGTNIDSRGLFWGERRAANDAEQYIDGVSNASIITSGGSLPDVEFYMSARNNNGVADAFNSRELCYGSLGLSIGDSKQLANSNALQTLQTTLGGRQV